MYNLASVNLANYDPTSYFLLLQFRVVVTGALFQWLFAKKLSRAQWASLVLLTMGCILKQYGFAQNAAVEGGEERGTVNWFLLLIMVQVMCSCFAGVYNEKLLKDTGTLSLQLQNQFMYLHSIMGNLLVLAFKGELDVVMSTSQMRTLLPLKVMVVILNNAAVGIVTSVFLRKLNSILKTFASALELFITAILSWFIFGIVIDIWTVVAMFIVAYAIYLYSRQPVRNEQKVPATVAAENMNGESKA